MSFRIFTRPLNGIILLYFLVTVCFTQPKTITILHTNDIHGSFIPHEAAWISTNPKPRIGGFLELQWLIDSIREKKSAVILLDGGDVMTGNPISDMKYMDSYGGALFEMMNFIGYDAWTIGNHDLDVSQENLEHLTKISAFPALSANLVDSMGHHYFNHQSSIVLTRGGIRLGIVGIMSKDLFRLTSTKNLTGIRVLDGQKILQKMIDSLDSITDLLIALTHQGFGEDSLMAENITGIDVIIGGHSHTRLDAPRLINNVIITQAGAYCENLGELELRVNDDAVVSYEGKLHPLWVRHELNDTPLRRMVDEYTAKLDSEYGKVIGTSVMTMKRSRAEETIIGTYIADAVRSAVGADIGIINSSGLRKDIPAGSITKMNIYETIPFRNFICTFKITGAELRRIVKEYVGSLKNKHTSLNFANIQCKWERRGSDLRLSSVLIGQAEIEDDKIYSCATIDYIIDQAERYLGFIPVGISTSDIFFFDAVVEKIERDQIIGSFTAPRFSEK
jgi:5'-nucleotidase/UDP-sugar diphosphatase